MIIIAISFFKIEVSSNIYIFIFIYINNKLTNEDQLKNCTPIISNKSPKKKRGFLNGVIQIPLNQFIVNKY